MSAAQIRPALPSGYTLDRRLPGTLLELEETEQHIEAVFPPLPAAVILFGRDASSLWQHRSSTRNPTLDAFMDHCKQTVASQQVALQYAIENAPNGRMLFNELLSLRYVKLKGDPNPLNTTHTELVSGVSPRVPWIHVQIVFTLWQLYMSATTTTLLPHAKMAELPSLLDECFTNITLAKPEAFAVIIQETLTSKVTSKGLAHAYRKASGKVRSLAQYTRFAPSAVGEHAKNGPPRPAVAADHALTEDAPPRGQKKSDELCKNWNKGFRCKRGAQCSFTHICSNCRKGKHPAVQCKSKSG